MKLENLLALLGTGRLTTQQEDMLNKIMDKKGLTLPPLDQSLDEELFRKLIADAGITLQKSGTTETKFGHVVSLLTAYVLDYRNDLEEMRAMVQMNHLAVLSIAGRLALQGDMPNSQRWMVEQTIRRSIIEDLQTFTSDSSALVNATQTLLDLARRN